MGQGENNTLQAIDDAIKNPRTPVWGRAILLAWRSDHLQLSGHLVWHEKWGKATLTIAVTVAALVVGSWLLWLLSGRWPSVF